MSYRTRVWTRRFIAGPRRWLRHRIRALRGVFRPGDYGSLQKRVAALEENQRRALGLFYPELAPEHDQRAALRRAEFQAFSENGEAGILLWLFSKVGTRTRRAIEFGIGNTQKCNTTNLVLSFGWSVLLLDGQSVLVEWARDFYRGRAEPERVRCVETWLTPETIDRTFAEHGMQGEIDLLSLDIDGNDYWIWKAIRSVEPRVVVIEYNSSLGAEEKLVAAYEPMFDRYRRHPLGWYHGASLAALEELGREKGYVLVGCESSGHNAFFVRRDLAAGKLEALQAKDAFYPNARRLRVATAEEQYASLRPLFGS
jgi:hypothetical protein